MRSTPRDPGICEHENLHRLRPLYFEGRPLYVCDDCGSELIDERGEWSRKALVEVKRDA